jgi:hypothetical protein
MKKSSAYRLEKLRERFLTEATSKQMIEELDEIIAELKSVSEEARKNYRVDL